MIMEKANKQENITFEPIVESVDIIRIIPRMITRFTSSLPIIQYEDADIL